MCVCVFPVVLWPNSESWPPLRGFSFTILGHTTLGRTDLYEWPAQHRDPYLTTHNTHKSQTSIPHAGFELTIPASQRPQTHSLDGAATGLGRYVHINSRGLHGIYIHKRMYLHALALGAAIPNVFMAWLRACLKVTHPYYNLCNLKYIYNSSKCLYSLRHILIFSYVPEHRKAKLNKVKRNICPLLTYLLHGAESFLRS
jgi:hypothetical protein